jgi:mannose-1-phosphate guanylyltransferase
VFAGGIGSRFWPLSTPGRPKPVLRLLGERPLLSDTVRRIAPVIPPERVLVLTSRDIADTVRAAVPELPYDNILVERRPLGTAAALAWGLHVVGQRGGAGTVTCALHADLAAAFPDAFRGALRRAASIALRERAVVTLAAAPTRAETSFGYVVPGQLLDAATPVDNGGACRIEQFIEKPPADAAGALVQSGALWHTGVLVARTDDAQRELFAHATELDAGREALAVGNLDAFAAHIRSTVSIERGLLERMRTAIALPVDCGWDDVGTWACLRRTRELDDDGNGAIGRAHFVDSASNVVHSEAGAVVLYGCSGMLVVTLPGLTFVTPLDRAADLKPLLDQLPGSFRLDPTRIRP